MIRYQARQLMTQNSEQSQGIWKMGKFLPFINLSLLVIVTVPVSIISRNRDDLNIDLTEYIEFAVLVNVALLATVAVVSWSLPKCFRVLQYTITFITAFALVNSLFLVADYGPLDGRGIVLKYGSPVALLQYGLLTALIVSSVVFRQQLTPITRTANQVMASFLIPFSIWQIAALAFAETASPSPSAKTNRPTVSSMRESLEPVTSRAMFLNGFRKLEFTEQFESLSKLSSTANVIHIVFDEMQGTVIEELFRENEELSKIFDGFIFYPDTLSLYSFTKASIPSMFSGTRGHRQIDNNVTEAIRYEFDDLMLIQNFRKNGYKVNIHTICSLFKFSGEYSKCSHMTERLAETALLIVLDLTLFRLSPEILKPFVYRDEKWFLQELI